MTWREVTGRLKSNRILRGRVSITLDPIVRETEEGGAVSAYVQGLPVYAAADSHAKAERASAWAWRTT